MKNASPVAALGARLVPGSVDPQALPGEIPAAGKIGFRAIGSKAVVRISKFRVTALE